MSHAFHRSDLAQPAAVDLVVETPCKDKGAIFTSTLVEHHLEARDLCLDCPGRELCLAAAELERFAEGTYGGVLFVDGVERHVDARSRS